jgi:hypothetical protein
MYEQKSKSPLTKNHFARRMVKHIAVAVAMLAVSLAIGMTGYAYFEHLSWLDAFLNSAMLIGGMGPIDPPHTTGGKFFAGCYALYAGLVFVVTVSLIVTPILHRLLHTFHWEDDR